VHPAQDSEKTEKSDYFLAAKAKKQKKGRDQMVPPLFHTDTVTSAKIFAPVFAVKSTG
jgi:hypothetical protein